VDIGVTNRVRQGLEFGCASAGDREVHLAASQSLCSETARVARRSEKDNVGH
jgi:hypothetical protein